MHEGYALRLYIEGGRGRLSEVSSALEMPRTSLYRIYGDPVIEKEIKEKLAKAGINIEGLNVSQSSTKATKGTPHMEALPKTVEEYIDLLKKVIAALERELAVKDKYILLLEGKLNIT